MQSVLSRDLSASLPGQPNSVFGAEQTQQPRLKRAAADLVYQFLTGNPCAECGESDILVLEFNHLDPRVKSANVSDLIRSCTSSAGIQVEMAKCEVLCANCHQRRTSLERSRISNAVQQSVARLHRGG